MKRGRLRVRAFAPGAGGWARWVGRWGAKPGIVTSFSDRRLPVLRSMLADDAEAEVVPFGELLGRAITATGVTNLRLASPDHVRAIVELAGLAMPAGSPFSLSARYPGTHRALTSVLDELRHWGIGTDAMRQAAELAPTRLSLKLLALAELQESIDSALDRAGYEQSTDRIAHLLDAKEFQPDALGRLLVVAGSDEYPSACTVLRRLAELGVSVEVIVEALTERTDLFLGARRVAEALGSDGLEFEGEPTWASALFSESVAPDPPRARVFSAADPLAECEWAFREALGLMRAGTLPTRIAIFARDQDAYAPLLAAAARRLDVPVQLAVPTPLLTNSLAAFALALLEALALGDVRAMVPIARSVYLKLDSEQRVGLESAVRQSFRQHEAQWSALREYARSIVEEQPWLEFLLGWRQDAMAEPAPMRAWIERLRRLLMVPPLPETATDPTNRSSERDTRAQTSLLRALVEYAAAFDHARDRPVGLAEFAQTCRKLWESARTMVPSETRHGVFLVTAGEALPSVDAVFALGMLEGSFPRRRREEPILEDAERRWISEHLRLAWPLQTSFDHAQAERDEFVRLCAAPLQSLVLAYPQADEDRDNVPAFYLEELRRAVPCTETHDYARSLYAPPEAECPSVSDLALRRALDDVSTEPKIATLSLEEARQAIEAPTEEGVSPRELASAYQCPFQAAARYRLDLRGPEGERVRRRLTRLPSRAALVSQPTPEFARAALNDAIRDELEDLLGHLELWELRLFEASARRMVEGWIEREFACRAQWGEPEQPILLDVELSHPQLRDSLKVLGRTVKLRGKAPAVFLRAGYAVLRAYEHSASVRSEWNEQSEFDLMVYGLEMAALVGLARSRAIEIDATSGKRTVLALRTGQDKPIPGGAGMEVIAAPEMERPEGHLNYQQEVKRRLEIALMALDRKRMRASPGAHCQSCDLGELCRAHAAFGDATTGMQVEEADPD